MWTIPLVSKNAISMSLILDLNCLAFFGFGDDGHFHWRLWRLVLGHIRRFKTHHQWWLGSVWRCSRMSWHTSTRRSFWSSSRSFDTIFAQIFHIPKSSVIIFHMLTRLISISSAIIWTVNRRSPRTICFTRSALSAVLLVEGLPLLESCSTSLRSSLNHLCHSKTHERLISVHFLQHSKCIRWSFSQPDQKLQIDTLLCCHGLTREI